MTIGIYLLILFKISCPIFLSSPPFVVGIPVFWAMDCLMPVIPIALFNENDNPFVSFIAFSLNMVYL